MSEILLTGLDGGNPLGFLAGLGVLEALAAEVQALLAWRDIGGWKPELTGFDGSLEDLIERIDADRAACQDEPALALEYDGKQDLKPTPARFRAYLGALVARSTPGNRRGGRDRWRRRRGRSPR